MTLRNKTKLFILDLEYFLYMYTCMQVYTVHTPMSTTHHTLNHCVSFHVGCHHCWMSRWIDRIMRRRKRRNNSKTSLKSTTVKRYYIILVQLQPDMW